MYTPSFNSVLVEIDDADAKWGTGNEESMLGKSYNKGTVIAVGDGMATRDYPETNADMIVVGRAITWNEGTEAGTLFEEDGKLYGFIYWWDIRGVNE